jgi:hypothetical protein
VLTGRLRVAGMPSLQQAARHSPAFVESVRRAESAIPALDASARQRIITFGPAADRVVPAK